MNRYARWAFALAVLPVAACADNTPAAPMAPPAPPAMAANDMSFVTAAAQGGMAEIQEAQLALSMTRNPRVRMFANKMVTDHTQADDQLKQIVTAKGGTLPTDVNDMQMQQMTALKADTGRKFDPAYISDQIQDHQAMLELFSNEATNGTDPDIKKFAADTLPVVQSHLDMAKKLSMGGRMMHHHMRHHMAADTTN